MSTTVIELVPGRLYALAHALELDGRLTMFGPDARGHTVANSYLFVEGRRALLVDTSYSVHEEGLLAALDEVLPPGAELELFPPRLGEFDAVCNVVPVVERFGVQVLHCAQHNGTHWVDFRPEHRGRMPPVREVIASSQYALHLGPDRPLHAFHPVMRLLSTHWIHDPATGALFVSDTFSHTWRDTPDGPWTTDSSEPAPAPGALLERMAAARFWWLRGARTAPLREGLAETFATYPVEILAPSYGAVVLGADAVAAHVASLDGALALAAEADAATPGDGAGGMTGDEFVLGATRGVNPLPRELVPGIFWLGQCLEQLYRGRILHGYNSTYLVTGEHSSLLVEGGHPQDLPVIEAQLEGLLAAGAPPLRHIVCTHQETPHAGGVGRLLQRHPEAVLSGDLRDLHLIFPAFTDRFRELGPGGEIDLGATRFRILAPVIYDLDTTLWGFDERRRVLFPGDGFAYSHYHEDGHCGQTAEESPSLDLAEMTALFAELALYWTRFQDLEPYIARLRELLDELDVQVVAPTHGLPIKDLPAILPEIVSGLRLGSAGTGSGMSEVA